QPDAQREAAEQLLPRFEHVPRLPDGADEGRPEGVELLPQVADIRLDDVRVSAEVVLPDVLENLALREHAARVQQEEPQQCELGRGQLDARLAAEDLVSRFVEADVRKAQDVAWKLAACAPEDRLHAGDDLREAERLRDVVVPAGAESVDLVLDRVL